jgi:hypothetical protein
MAADGFTTVHVTTDPVEGEMLADALRSEAIEARVQHVNSALLGAGPQLFEIRIDVADESLAQARAILDELRAPALAEELSTAPAEGDDAPPAPARDPRKVGVGLLLPGAGHFYAGRPWTALVLEVGIFCAIVALRSRPSDDFASNLAFATIFAIVAADVGGAWLALRALARAPAPPDPASIAPSRQVERGAKLLGVALAGGSLAATLVALPGWLRAGDLARLVVNCTDEDVTIANTGKRDRYVSLDHAYVQDPGLPSGLAGRVHAVDNSAVRVAAGQKIVRTIAPDDGDVVLCRLHEEQYGPCALLLHLTIQDLDPPSSEPLAVSGRCVPDWSGARAPSRATLELDEGEALP